MFDHIKNEEVLLDIIEGYITIAERLNLSDVFELLGDSIAQDTSPEAARIRTCLAFHKQAIASKADDSLEDILTA